jgi:hypothetical protein
MKVVVNKCFGGFGISAVALKELVMRDAKCLRIMTPKHYYGGEKPMADKRWQVSWDRDFAQYIDLGDGMMGHKQNFNIYKDGVLYDIKDTYEDSSVRNDKDLVEVVEKLGELANGHCAELKIVEIPDGVEYDIDEYDGMETIHEKHRSW